MNQISIIYMIFIFVNHAYTQQYPKEYISAKGYSYPLSTVNNFKKNNVVDSTEIIEITYKSYMNYSFLDTLLKHSEIIDSIVDFKDIIPFFILEGHTYEHGIDTFYFYHSVVKWFICKYESKLYELDKSTIDNVLKLLPYYHYLMFRRRHYDL